MSTGNKAQGLMDKIPKLLGILEYVLFLLVLSDSANLYCLELPIYPFKESHSPLTSYWVKNV